MITKIYKREEWIDVNSSYEIKGIKIYFNNISIAPEKFEMKCDKCGSIVIKSDIRSNVSLCKVCTRKQTNLEKYGDENYVNSGKAKETNLEKYGSTCNLHGINQEKIQQIKLEKYGNYNNFHKIQQTNLEKYGVKNTFQSEEIKEKSKQTKLEKYGNEYYLNREKAKQTNFKIFGHENYFGAKSTIEKNRKNRFINLIESDRLKKLVIPLFSLEEYKTSHDLYRWKCCKCNNIFESNIENGKIPRCLNCFPLLSTTSKVEKEIVDWIKSLNIEIDENNRIIINPLELDIYIPSHNLAIEFDGLYWHSELNGQKDSNYHLNKTNKCSEKGIHLLHIFEDEWIEKQDIIKSIIKNNLGLHDTIIYGRNCVVKNISSKEANEFYDINHIQGSCASSINLGLYYQDELISCLSFAKPRFNKKYDWEITRFANKLNYKIHGSFGKLWKYRPVGSIITYSDKRYFSGTVYKKYMKQLTDSKPAYWYVKNCQRYNRVEFQKHKLASILASYDSNFTEWENMQLNGYDRIYDCGNWVFEFI